MIQGITKVSAVVFGTNLNNLTNTKLNECIYQTIGTLFFFSFYSSSSPSSLSMTLRIFISIPVDAS